MGAALLTPDEIGTEDLLTLYERLVGKLDERGRQRLLQAAYDRGWDRTWSDVALAT
jgi:hypothetical protein